MLGTLYGIGVGPGDPELITLKAVRVLNHVSHVFAAASSKNDYSLAFDIVRDHLPPDNDYSLAFDIVRDHLPPETPVSQMAFPMTFNADRLENAWQANCEEVIEILEQGKDVAFLTLGDPLTFSTFIYLMRKVRHRLTGVTVTVIPGITSFQAAAACATVPLSEGEESITVISGAKGGDRLKDVVEFSDNIILMKTYKQFSKILGQVKEVGMQDRCCFISRCGLDGQIIERDFDKISKIDQPNYLSLMILKKRGIEE